jgi:TPP-dependent pyruvate/acetoin dehydrogenase alpha subunit
MKRDPIITYRQRLLDDGIDAAAIDAIEAEQTARVDAAEGTARNSGPPPLDIAEIDLWSDGSSIWRN